MASRNASRNLNNTPSKKSLINTKQEKPSAKINPKTVDPFEKKKGGSVFASAYQKGAVPCRLLHGSVRNKLQWTVPPETLDFDPILIILAEGLKETIHPYSFVAHEGFMQLLAVQDAESKTLPLLPKLILPLKNALTNEDEASFYSSLEALVQLSNLVGPSLNPHLKNLLPQLSRRMMKKNGKERVTIALQKIECNGGKEATSVVKARIPTYSSVL